ncbi:MAG: oxidoreductase [Pseudomonadota bacterium]
MTARLNDPLFEPLELPCGAVLKNRIVKSAMSDSLGDGRGNPTPSQRRLYKRWAEGGLAAAIIGEVQGDPAAAEKPGNLVLRPDSDAAAFEALAQAGSANGAQLWLQLGHAGAMAYPPIGAPKGPSALDLPGLSCAALSLSEILELPAEFARTAALAKQRGFGGVQIHAAHGFLLSQFLSPLFNKRADAFGGAISARMRLLLDVVEAVRGAVGARFPVAVKLNATDQLAGGFDEDDALKVVAALDRTAVDLIDISGGTYFPGAASASDRAGRGPYFLTFAERARRMTSKPLMVTGGFKTARQAANAVSSGAADMVGLARALALDPELPNKWRANADADPMFPKFQNPPEGGVTAWFTMRLKELGEDRDLSPATTLDTAISDYLRRDEQRVRLWKERFG